MKFFKIGDKVKFRKDRGFNDDQIYTISYHYIDGTLMQQFVKFKEKNNSTATINLEKVDG